jgi:hypothetical protein
MARVTYGGIITSINGSIGGTVFQDNKYGKTVKNSPNMKLPNSPFVFNNQRMMVQAAQGWRSITSAQRSQFDLYSTTYPQYTHHNSTSILSGYGIFLKWWFILARCGYSVVSNPTIAAVVLPSFTPSLHFSDADLNFTLGASTLEGDISFAIFLSGIYPSSHNFPPSNFRYITVMALDSEPSTINSIYLANFGALPAIGNTVFCRVVPFGLLSPMVFNEQYFKLTI